MRLELRQAARPEDKWSGLARWAHISPARRSTQCPSPVIVVRVLVGERWVMRQGNEGVLV